MPIDATGWAWGQDLPPTEKLVLLYLSDRGDTIKYDPAQAARFVGTPVHQLGKVMAALDRRGLIRVRAKENEAVLVR